MIALLLAALLSLPAQAQEMGQFNSSCFLGLNDADTPAVIPPCESPTLLNVESNLDGTAILKRKGYSKFADLTIATSPVTGSHSFIDSSGNRLDIVCQDRNCAKSTNGNAFATFLTTAASGITRWSFVDQGGILYGANNKFDPIMKYDGTTRTSPVGMPLGSILALTQDRLAVGDIQNLPNRVHYSSAGAYEQFTVGVNPEDSFFDDIGADGDRIRGIKCIQGNCFIFKTASITLCEMADQYNTRCSVISPNIGTTDPASIVAAGSSLYFRAQDKNYWEIGRNGLVQISKKIPNLIKSQSGGLGGGENTNTQTTQADWQAGTQLPLSSWNTATNNGSIFPSSSTTMVDTSSSDFSGGTLTNLSLTDVIGSVVLDSSTFQDNFADLDFSANPLWTAAGNNFWSASTGKLKYDGVQDDADLDGWIYSSVPDSSSGSWSFNLEMAPGAGDSLIADFIFSSSGSTPSSTSGYMLRIFEVDDCGTTLTVNICSTVNSIYRIDSGSLVLLSSVSLNGANFPSSITVKKSSGAISALVGANTIAANDTTYANTANLVLRVQSGIPFTEAQHGFVTFDNIYWFKYHPITGSFTSRIFDTSFSTPTWGSLSSTFTAYNASGEGNIAFYVQSSTANDGGGFTSLISASDTIRPSALAQKRYVRYTADFSTLVSTKSPSLDATSLSIATTGQFRTQCIQPNSSISAWGTLSCAQTLAGAGSEVFYATSAATCAALPTTHPVDSAGAVQSGWTAQTNNATVTIATNTAVYIGWRSLLGSATDQAQVDSCVLAWNEGTPSQPSWAAYDSRKNAIYWTSTIDGASATNRLLKYDLNLEQWYPFNLAAQAPKVINNTLYFGGAAAGTWNTYGLVDADAGASINAFWESKDVGSDRPFQEKDFQKLSILSRNQGTGSMTGTWTLSNAQTGSYTISLSTGTGITYARSNFNLPKRSPQQFMKVRIGNNNSTPFEVLGLGITWSVLPWRVSGP